MRIFHELAFEGYISSTSNYYSAQKLMELMGSVDITHVGGYATQVTGTSVVLYVYPLFSADGHIWWAGGAGTGIINGVSLSTSQETLFQGNEPYFAASNGQRLRFMRLWIYLTGTNPAAYVRLWVTGRDQSRRAKSLMRPLKDVEEIHSMTG